MLKIDAQNMPTLTLGDSSQLLLGQRVVALGYALALNGGDGRRGAGHVGRAATLLAVAVRGLAAEQPDDPPLHGELALLDLGVVEGDLDACSDDLTVSLNRMTVSDE